MQYLVWLNLLLLAFDGISFWKSPYSIHTFFRLCYTFILGFGIIFVQLMDLAVGYKFALPDLTFLELRFLYGYLLIIAGSAAAAAASRLYFPTHGKSVPPIRNQGEAAAARVPLLTLAALSAAAVLLYVGISGVSFGQGSYEARYESAIGLGILLIFFPAFLPYATYRLVTASRPRVFVAVAVATIALSSFIYVALNGYRQILIAVLLLIVVVGIRRGYIVAWAAAVLGLIGLPSLILGLSFLRYQGETSFPFSSPWEAAWYYVQGDLFPIDAAIRVEWYCRSFDCPGPALIANHLLRIVPRFIWPSKPEIMLDPAGYYTQYVIDYGRTVTLSPTILGELGLIGGIITFTLLMFLSGVLTRLLTTIIKRGDPLLKMIVLSNVYIGFFWVREGFSNGLYRILVIFIFYVIARVGSPFMAELIGRQKTKRRGRRRRKLGRKQAHSANSASSRLQN